MRTVVTIYAPNRDKLGDHAFDDLVAIYPAGRDAPHAFSCTLPAEDQRTRLILERLAKAGYQPWTDKSRSMDFAREFIVDWDREYSAADLAECDFLELWSRHQMHGISRDGDGRIKLLEGNLDSDADFAQALSAWYVIPDRARCILEAGGLRHVKFRPTVLLQGRWADAKAEPVDWSKYGEPWWEITSDYVLPPLSPHMTFTNRYGKPVRHGEFSDGFHVREGLYQRPELRYGRSNLNSCAPFDLARTLEPQTNGPGFDRNDCPLIVSRRFYQFCCERGLQAEWVPVRLD